MRTLMFAVAAGSSWAVFAYKLRDLRTDPHNPFLKSFCVSILLISVSFTIGLPPLVSRIEQATGVLAIWDTGVIVVGCAAAQVTLLLWADPPELAWPKIRPRLVVYSVATVAMVVLDVRGRIDPANVDVTAYAENPELLYGTTRYVADAFLVYVGALGYATLAATRYFWRSARLIDRRWLQRGLRILSVGCGAYFASCLSIGVFAVALRFGVEIGAAQRAETVTASIGQLILAVGATMPAWGPRVDRIVSYRRLRPLWYAVCQAAPEVVLDPPHSSRADHWKPWDMNFRLYRRIIEIRDGCLALRPYLDEEVASRARRLGERAGLDGIELNAAVEAATLTAAIDAKASGRPGLDRAGPVLGTSGGSDLAGELAWLTKVAGAFARSPVKLM
jgi:hypothetical protein